MVAVLALFALISRVDDYFDKVSFMPFDILAASTCLYFVHTNSVYLIGLALRLDETIFRKGFRLS